MALADSDVVKTILGQFKIKVDDLKRQIESEAKRGEKPFEGEIGVSPRVKDALSRAFVASNELSHSYVGPEHFLIGLAEEGEGLAANLLRRYGLTPQALRQQVSKVVGKGAEDGRAEAPTNTPELDKYSRDLTKMARDGKLDPVIGRAQEIETTIEVLARRKKNNPVLIGEPGVGKTAIVEGLAQRMVAGEVPETLRDKRLVELNINAMVAGAKYRGEFEERVQKVLKEVTEHQGELILFIDEVHTIVGAGQGGGEGTQKAQVRGARGLQFGQPFQRREAGGNGAEFFQQARIDFRLRQGAFPGGEQRVTQVEAVVREFQVETGGFPLFKLAGGGQDIVRQAGGFGHGHVNHHQQFQ